MSQTLPIEIIAHRGASRDAPENTLAAVRLGWEQGADAVEFDCHMTSDGRIVLIHDADTERTAGEKVEVAAATFDELQRLDVGSWKGSQWTGEPIPAIETIIETIPRGKRLFIEVKCGAEINEPLVEIFKPSRQPPEALAVISFDLAVVAGVKQAMPEISAYLIAQFERDAATGGWSPTVEELVEIATQAGLDGLDVQSHVCVDRDFVATARKANLDTYIWTVDDAADAQRLIAAGVRGIATNCPAWLRAELLAAGVNSRRAAF